MKRLVNSITLLALTTVGASGIAGEQFTMPSASRNSSSWDRGSSGPQRPDDIIQMLQDNEGTNPSKIVSTLVAPMTSQWESDPTKLSDAVKTESIRWDVLLGKLKKAESYFDDWSVLVVSKDILKALEEVLDGSRDLTVLEAFKTGSEGYGALKEGLIAVSRERIRKKISEAVDGACFTHNPKTYQKQLDSRAQEIQESVQTDYERLLAVRAFGVKGMFLPLPSDASTVDKIPTERRDVFKTKIADELTSTLRSAIHSVLEDASDKCVNRSVGSFDDVGGFEIGNSPFKRLNPVDKLLISERDKDKLQRIEEERLRAQSHSNITAIQGFNSSTNANRRNMGGSGFGGGPQHQQQQLTPNVHNSGERRLQQIPQPMPPQQQHRQLPNTILPLSSGPGGF